MRIVSNPSTRSPPLIVCEQSRTSSMIMPAWCSRDMDMAVFCFRVERKVRHMRAVEGCEFVVFTTTPGQSQVQFYSGLHALANRLVLHVFSSSHCVIFSNVTFSSLVCSLFATWLSPHIMHGDCSSWCTRPTSQFTGHRMRLLKSNAELDMLSAFKSFLTLMFLCC